MTPTDQGESERQSGRPHSGEDAAWLLESHPAVRAAIQQRIDDHPEYRRWLQQYGSGVLHALESAS